MRKIVGLGLLLMTLISCKEEPKVQKEVLDIPVSIKVDRFDKAFFETDPNDLSKLKDLYPEFFSNQVADSVWIEKMTNPLWRELYSEVQKQYANFDEPSEDLELLFKHIRYYYPNTEIPKIVTYIGEMDYENKIVYNGKYLLIALELYLGENHEFYKAEFPDFLSRNFRSNQILPDIVSEFALTKVRYPLHKSFLELMVYEGKKLYMKDLFLPNTSDAEKLGYTEDQILWSQSNEAEIWRYFIDENILYSTDSKTASRFINAAPFSKFYLEIDNESPGRIGAYVGWQIVRSFAKNNNVNLDEMLQMEASEIFNKSKYKPKK